MKSSSINLLPQEFAISEKEKKRFGMVQMSSIMVLLVLFLVASVIVSLKIVQSREISTTNTKIGQLETRIAQFKDKEATLFVLKNRLASITRILNLPSKQLISYNYAEENLPGGITVTSIASDRSGNLVLAMLVPDTITLGNVLDSLTDQAAFDVFNKVDVENMARTKDGVYRLSVRLSPK